MEFQMANGKMFKVGGVSKINGEYKVRFTHDLTYVKGLAKAGNTDIELVEAPSEMTKIEMVAFLKTTDLYKRPEFKEAIDARGAMYEPKTVKVKAVKVTKAAKDATPSLAKIKARAAKVAKVEAEPVTEVVAEADPV
jgi:hypothetical protein